jgi:cell shape-determining protein MreC
MEKPVNLKDYQKQRYTLTSNYLGYFKNAEQQLRSIVIEILEAFVDIAPTENQIVELEAQLKAYFAKRVNSTSLANIKE